MDTVHCNRLSVVSFIPEKLESDIGKTTADCLGIVLPPLFATYTPFKSAAIPVGEVPTLYVPAVVPEELSLVTVNTTMNLNYSGGNRKIVQAVNIANKMFEDPAFYQQIEAFASFAYSTYSGQQVAAEIRNAVMEITVDTYWNPFGSATAKTQTEININTAKLNRSIASIVNTVVHESVHSVDWAVNRNGIIPIVTFTKIHPFLPVIKLATLQND